MRCPIESKAQSWEWSWDREGIGLEGVLLREKEVVATVVEVRGMVPTATVGAATARGEAAAAEVTAAVSEGAWVAVTSAGVLVA